MANQFFFDKEIYSSRRAALMQNVGSGKLLLLGNDDSSRNFVDNIYPFRQDSSFLYYAGINLPGLAVVIDVDSGNTTLFGDDVSLDMVIWTGPQTPMAELAAKVGIDTILPISKLKDHISDETKILPPYRGQQTVKLKALLGVDSLVPDVGFIKAVVKQRNVKSEEEISELDKAVGLSAKMHEHVIRAAKPGMYEYELVAIAQQFALANQTDFAYPAILTIHGETLHNHYYGNQLKEGDILLYDGGVELTSGYCGDLTRTFPVASSFTDLQAAVYDTVRSGYLRAKELSKPGISYQEVHLEVCKELVRGLQTIGWMKGDVEEAVAEGAHTMFFQHGLGHMMGLDVHDMENLGENLVGYGDEVTRSTEFGSRSLRLGQHLQSGNVITIEPGIYVIPELYNKFRSENKFEAFIDYQSLEKNLDFGGIRIEDDFVITQDGCRQLGEPLVTERKEIERMRG